MALFNVGPDGTTAVVLLNGSAQLCGPGGCRELKKRCDCVVAKRNGEMTAVRRVDRSILRTLGSTRALPFLSGNQALSGKLGSVGIGCSFARTAVDPLGRNSAPGAHPASPAPGRPDRQPDTPSAPSTPDQPNTPNTPDQPNTPDMPDKPHVDKGKEHHHEKSNHDRDDDRDDEDGHHDRDHRGHDDGRNNSGHPGRGQR